MTTYRYSKWDGSQDFHPIDVEHVMDELSEHLMNQGDLSSALSSLMEQGVKGDFGGGMKGLQDLAKMIRTKKDQTLQKYDINSVIEGLREKLAGIKETERNGIEKRLEEARKRLEESKRQGKESKVAPEVAESLLRKLNSQANKNLDFLQRLPEDPSGTMSKLKGYEFMDSLAKADFDELLKTLQGQVAESYFKNMSSKLKDMKPQDLGSLKNMLNDLNSMLEDVINAKNPGSKPFLEKWGEFFSQNAPKDLDELVDQISNQIGQVQSILESMQPEQREHLQGLMNSIFGDDEFQMALERMSSMLGRIREPEQHKEYTFSGGESVTLQQAMDVMTQLGAIDGLEQHLRHTQHSGMIMEIDKEDVDNVLGNEGREALEQLQRLSALLEEAGYIKKVGNRFELTPRGMRKIGQKALAEIFGIIRKDKTGKHASKENGPGFDRTEESKPYEFGDPFHIDLQRTLSNALERNGTGIPVRLAPKDFEVYRTELTAHSSTVLMLDLSLSMAMRGNFVAAKKVALALDSLIRSQFPRDSLYIVGFSTYAREVRPEKLAFLSWNEFDPYTNIQHGLALAQKLLSRERGGTKQIIMVSDGEPTAHIEDGQLFSQYPPSHRTLRETLREVKRCTQSEITINTFMLDRDSYLMDFVDQLTKINHGRIFYTSADRLGQYILVDYMSNKKRKALI
ncbi:MAG: VWA domain-containing protein [Dehalococcoidia bacterium]|nr:VWA domain-containing protein [Dehalococcoidia bacterium]